MALTTEEARRIDCEIAEKVMGKVVNTFQMNMLNPKYKNTTGDPMVIIPEPVPYYSTDIAAAWQVFEKINENFDITIETDNGHILVSIQTYDENGYERALILSREVTAPLAICKAALEAVDGR